MPAMDGDEKIGQAIKQPFYRRIINGAAAGDKSAAEDAIVALVQFSPVDGHVATIVRFVGHHDYDCVIFQVLKPLRYCAAESVLVWVLDGLQRGNVLRKAQESCPRGIRAPVVHNDDLVRNLLQA